MLPLMPLDHKNQFPEIHPVVLQLLYNRGTISQNAIDEFLSPDYGRDIHDPFLFKDMEKGVRRILEAALKKEKVLVYGDYDADGVCSTALMTETLKAVGINPDVYIPFREKEGYGMNMEAVAFIIEKSIKLVITVDCGIANIDEVSELKKHGIDVIVTDHHNPQKRLPEAFAIIDPKREGEQYPTTEICGTAVAYKVAQAIFSERIRQEFGNAIAFPVVGWEKWLLDLVAIGTVTDLVLLLGESRALVTYGMFVLNKTRRPGLRALFEIAGIIAGKIDTHTIGFQIGPRLNAAGRMDHASTSYELLINENGDEVIKIARSLNEKNQERQKISDRMYQQALAQTESQSGECLLSAYHESWSPSLVGLAAGKLMEAFSRPALVMGKNQQGKIVGSGRSVEGFDITSAMEQCKEYLARFGGHALACGFTLKDETRMEPFIRDMRNLCRTSIGQKELVPQVIIELECGLADVNWEVVEAIERFAPFGPGNHKPTVLIRQCVVAGFQTVGQNGNHLKGVLTDGHGTLRNVIGFSLGEWCKKLNVGALVDMVCQPSINEWNGNREIQLKIIDLKEAEKL